MQIIIHRQNRLMADGTSCVSSCIRNSLHGNSLVIHILRTMFTVLYSVCPSPFICAIVSLLACSLYLAWKLLHLHDDNIIRYVVCPKCESV